MSLSGQISTPRDRPGVVAICSTFPCEPLRDSLEFWLEELELELPVEFAPPNQTFQQLLDSASLLRQNARGVNVLLIRFEDWAGPSADGELNLEEFAEELVASLRSATGNVSRPIVVCLCPPSASVWKDAGRLAGVRAAERLVAAALAEFRHVHLLDSIEQSPGSDDDLFFARLGTLLARHLHSRFAAPHKLVVLDCNQTLWAGICAEDGAVEIDPPRRALQEFMVRQRDAGMLLALCSKNHEADVFRVFDRRPDMPLRREHLAAGRINWRSKSENLRSLADELQIGLEWIIFIDDDPVECAEMRARCPEVLALQLPDDPADIEAFLENVWAFDRPMSTKEDRLRAGFCRDNARRDDFRRDSTSLREFIEKLELSVEISPLVSSDLARVAQLTQRTSQFNFTTARRLEAELAALCRPNGRFEGLTVRARDRFGDYGLVGVMLFDQAGDALVVDTFLLSCRALGRGIEHKMFAHLAELAGERGLARMEATFIASRRNEPALVFLDGIATGSKRVGHEGSESQIHYSWPAAGLAVNVSGSAGEWVSGKPDTTDALTHRLTHSPTHGTSSTFWQRIATEGRDPMQILEAIAARRRDRAALIGEAEATEAALKSHPDIREVAVRLRTAAGRPRLAAYVAADPRRSPRIAGRLRHPLPNGLAIVQQSRLETETLYREIFEEQVYLRHGVTLRDGDCVIDAGANIGLFALFVQLTRRDTRVYAFEPAPPIFDLLRLNATLYAPTAKLFDCGLSDRSGSGTFRFHPSLSGASGYHPEPSDAASSRTIINRQLEGLAGVGGGRLPRFADQLLERAAVSNTFETPVRPLSEFLVDERIERVHLLKVDVEKSEIELLRGIRAEHWDSIDQVVIEAHNLDLASAAKALLQAMGFAVNAEQQPLRAGTDFFLLYAIRPERRRDPQADAPSPIPARFAGSFGGDLLSAAQVRSFVKRKLRRLPGPFDIVFLDSLPRRSDGNLDESLLAPPTPAHAEIDNALSLPRTPMEGEVARLWQSVLGLSRVGIDENFFDLGGHSLLATTLLSRVQDVFGIELPLASLFNAPNVAGLARCLETRLLDELDEGALVRAIQSLDELRDGLPSPT